jgi:hypothetical protein
VWVGDDLDGVHGKAADVVGCVVVRAVLFPGYYSRENRRMDTERGACGCQGRGAVRFGVEFETGIRFGGKLSVRRVRVGKHFSEFNWIRFRFDSEFDLLANYP